MQLCLDIDIKIFNVQFGSVALLNGSLQNKNPLIYSPSSYFKPINLFLLNTKEDILKNISKGLFVFYLRGHQRSFEICSQKKTSPSLRQ